MVTGLLDGKVLDPLISGRGRGLMDEERLSNIQHWAVGIAWSPARGELVIAVNGIGTIVNVSQVTVFTREVKVTRERALNRLHRSANGIRIDGNRIYQAALEH